MAVDNLTEGVTPNLHAFRSSFPFLSEASIFLIDVLLFSNDLSPPSKIQVTMFYVIKSQDRLAIQQKTNQLYDPNHLIGVPLSNVWTIG